MKVLATVQFQPDEVEVFVRAMGGHEHTIQYEEKEGLRLPVRVYLNRIRQEEPLDLNELEDLGDVLDDLIYQWQAEVTPEAWREMGAPGADDAIEGLAQERRLAIDRAVVARTLVADALVKATEASAERRVTKAERKAESAR